MSPFRRGYPVQQYQQFPQFSYGGGYNQNQQAYPYSNQNQNPLAQVGNVKALPAAPEQKQITAGPDTGSQPNNQRQFQRQPFRPYNSEGRAQRPYQGPGTQQSGGGGFPQGTSQEVYYGEPYNIHGDRNEWQETDAYHGQSNPYSSQEEMYYGQQEEYHDAKDRADTNENVDPKDDGDAGFVAVTYYINTAKIGENHNPMCRKCEAEFASNNLLHKHLKQTKCKSSRTPKRTSGPKRKSVELEVFKNLRISPKEPEVEALRIIESTAPPLTGSGMSFRSWNFLITKVSFTPSGQSQAVCADTGCGMTMIDREFIKIQLPHIQFQKLENPVIVKGIEANRHTTDEYCLIDLYMKGKTKLEDVLIKITKKVHIVDNLKAKLLMGMDLLGSEGAIIDISKQRIQWTKCQDA